MAFKPTGEIFQLKPIGWLSVPMQLFLIVGLFLVTTALEYQSFRQTGSFHGYPVSVSLLFAPIYEEILFRGAILLLLLKRFSLKKAVILSCLLFGVWHIKNIFYLSPARVAYQSAYAALFIGPILVYLAIRLKNIWPGVIVHYVNNIIAFALTPKLLNLFTMWWSNR